MGVVVLPLAVTVTASPTAASTQLFRRVRLTALRALVCVHVMAVSAGLIARVVPLSGVVLPLQASVES
ncbi:hypothetical protein D3C71_1484090 [compost metagenome]